MSILPRVYKAPQTELSGSYVAGWLTITVLPPAVPASGAPAPLLVCGT